MPIGKQSQSEFNDNDSRCGVSDIYDRTRGIPNSGKNDGKGRRNDSYRKFTRNDRYSQSQRWVNCDVGGKVEYDDDNGNYPDGDLGNSDYQGGHPIRQVNFAEIECNYSSIEIELGDVGSWNTDIGVGDYQSNHSAAKEYRDSGRAGDCDVFKTFAKTNSAKNINVEMGGRYIDLVGIWGNTMTNSRFVERNDCDPMSVEILRRKGMQKFRKHHACILLAITSVE